MESSTAQEFNEPLPTLYRFFDASGVLLYVGITVDPGARLRHHRTHKPWWAEVARIDIEHFGSQRELGDAERAAIAEAPRHNILHNKSTERPRDQAARALRQQGMTWGQVQQAIGVSARTTRRIAERLRKENSVN